MKRYLLVILFLFFPIFVSAQSLSGKVILDSAGTYWYINPANNYRYSFSNESEFFRVVRERSIAIKETDFQQVAQGGMPVSGNLNVAKKYAGRIVLRIEKNGEAWYINPSDSKKYPLGKPDEAFRKIKTLSATSTPQELKSYKRYFDRASIDQYSRYYLRKIALNRTTYALDVIEIDLNNPKLAIKTVGTGPYPNEPTGKKMGKFGVKSLKKYVEENNAFAGINATYFECYDKSRLNYYFFPMYDSNAKKIINESELKYWTTGPIMAWDDNNRFYYYKDSRDFKAVLLNDSDGFKLKTNDNGFVRLAAAIGNKPRLIENKLNQLIEWEVDKKQMTLKTTRNAIGYKDGKIYLVVAYKSTVPILAELMKKMGMEYSLNLDGGYSTAMMYDGEFVAGPGRDIANAILFATK